MVISYLFNTIILLILEYSECYHYIKKVMLSNYKTLTFNLKEGKWKLEQHSYKQKRNNLEPQTFNET